MENNGDIKLIKPNLRNQLLDLEYLKNRLIETINGNDLQKNNILGDISSYFIQDNLGELILTQPDLGNYFNIEQNLPQIIIARSGVLAWKNHSESVTTGRYKHLVLRIDIIKDLIKKEIEK